MHTSSIRQPSQVVPEPPLTASNQRFTGPTGQTFAIFSAKSCSHNLPSYFCLAFLFVALITGSFNPQTLAGAQAVPIYVDDSPEAWELFGRAADQLQRDNHNEVIRIYQRLLDEFGRRLVPRDQLINTSASADNFVQTTPPTILHPTPKRTYTTVRQRVHDTLSSNPKILTLYRHTSQASAQKLLDNNQFTATFNQHFLTTAGYHAGLALTEQEIRRGHFADAFIILYELENHPDFNSPQDHQLQRWAKLLALAALYAQDDAAYQRALDELNHQPASQHILTALHHLADTNANQLPNPQSIADTDTRLANPSLSQLSTKPVWSFLFESGPQTVLRQDNLSTNERRNIRDNAEAGKFGNFIPTAAADVILACDGISIAALDRFDGQPRWRYPQTTTLRSSDKMRLRRGDNSNNDSADLSLVATDGRTVIGLIHHMTQGQFGQQSSNQLAALDIDSGRLKWTALTTDIDPTITTAFFHGSPILSEGKVIAIIRSARQRLASEYLAAFDLQTGALLWSQYIVSSPMPRSYSNLPPTRPLIHQGIIYLSSPHGCTSAINADNGATRWSVINTPEERSSSLGTSSTTRPFEASAPIWTPAGILADNAQRDSILLIDPTSGAVKTSFTHRRTSSPSYLLAGDTAVYLVGKRIRRITHLKLNALASIAPDLNTKPNYLEDHWPEIYRPASGEQIVGRVSAGQDHLIIPATKSLTLLNTTNDEISSQPWRGDVGTPLIIGSEVLVATNEGVDSYLPYTLAEPRLRARIKLDHTDPAPPISLARLAGRHRIFKDIRPAIDLAISTLNQDPFNPRNQKAQKQLFTTLLELASDPTFADQPGIGRKPIAASQTNTTRKRNTLAEDLYVRLDLIAFSIPQRLEYLFSFGAFLTRENQPAQAVNAYQEILTTPALAGAFFATEQRRVRAETEATHHLTELIRLNGTAIYALHEEAARIAFQNALQSPDFKTLLTIADQYPVAHTAVEACLQAGIHTYEQSNVDQAIFAWKLGIARTPTNNQRARLLGELLHALELEGRTDTVLFELRKTEIDFPNLNIIAADGTTTSLTKWRTNFIQRAGPQRRLPRIGLIQRNTPARQIRGDELLLPLFGRPSPAQTLVRTEKTIKAYGGSGLEELWQLAIQTADTELLYIDGETATLWQHQRGFPQTCIQISLIDGQPIWQTNIWGQPDNPDPEPGSQPFDRRTSRRIGRIDPNVGPNEIVFAIMSGDVVCLDRFDGSIRWTRKNILPEISQAYTDPFGVVVAGQSDLNNLEQSPVLLVLDPITGQTTNQVKIQSASDIRWLVGDDQGNTVAATRDSVLCYDIQAQKQRWRLTGATADLGDDPQVANELIYVTDTDTRLQTIDIKTGTIQHLPVLNLEETSATAPRTYAWDGRTLLKTSDGVYIFEYNLERTGQLARAGASDLAVSGVAVAEDRTIVLETVANPANANRKQLRLYGIDRTGKKLEHEIQPKTPLPKIDAAQAVDDWIVIDSGNYVIMFYAPVDPNNSTTNP